MESENKITTETSFSPLSINVGGKDFTTTLQTLCMCPFFKNMFNSNFKEKLNHKLIFIDRDPTGFKHVLRALRNSHYIIPDKWISEWEFYNPPENKDTVREIERNQRIKENDLYLLYSIIRNENENLKYVDCIISIKPYIILSNKTIFKIYKTFDVLLYPLIDYNLYDGTLVIDNQRIPFGNEKVFPQINVGVIYFQNISIEFNTSLEELQLVVRLYFNKKDIEKLSENHVYLEDGIKYFNGCLHYLNEKWLDPAKLLYESVSENKT